MVLWNTLDRNSLGIVGLIVFTAYIVLFRDEHSTEVHRMTILFHLVFFFLDLLSASLSMLFKHTQTYTL